MSTSQIACPNCGELIDIDKLVKHDIERQLRDEFEQKLKHESATLAAKHEHDAHQLAEQLKHDAIKLKELELEHLELERKHREQSEAMELDIRKRVLSEQQKIEERIRLQSQELFDLERKSEAARIDAERKSEAARIEAERRAEAERHELEKREMQKRLEDNLKLIEEMRRKSEQGSQQMQGEILELVIEEFLQKAFPFDAIEPVGKGQKGADCLHVVNEAGRRLGSIYYESKRTKHFSDEWIAKLKQDMRACGADVGVLVTEVMPKGMDRFGSVSGVWVCRFDEFKALCHVLRTMIVNVSNAAVSHENKGEKMAMLYQYLTGNEFRMQVEAIVEAFQTMQTDLAKERAQAERNWKQREKQIEKVMLNTVHMHASIKGIAGSEILEVRQLESPDDTTREPSALRP